ncbi:MAG TPA: prepilin peptidase, partial [Polyangia bacterium]
MRPRILALAWLHLLGFLAVYLIAVCTPFGQRAENALFTLNGAEPAWIYDWSGGYDKGALPPLDQTAMPTLVVGMVVLVAVVLVRRCWWSGIAAIGVVLVTFGASEVLHRMLPRPDLVGAPLMLT